MENAQSRYKRCGTVRAQRKHLRISELEIGATEPMGLHDNVRRIRIPKQLYVQLCPAIN